MGYRRGFERRRTPSDSEHLAAVPTTLAQHDEWVYGWDDG
jgi:hypothetical protein